MKHKKSANRNEGKTGRVIPLEWFAEIVDRKNRKHRQGNHSLDGFQLRSGEFLRAQAVRRNLKAIFEERNSPTRRDDFP
jgi:hypothetical protein